WYPLSRMSARAAASNAARVRSRLSPFGLPRGDSLFFLVIDNKIVHLFYNFNTRTAIMRARQMTGNPIEIALLPGVEAGELAGAAALVWRHGAVQQIARVGRRALVSGLPVDRATIFRIASATKPVTTVAALTLVDEGSFDLDEPITGCAPE